MVRAPTTRLVATMGSTAAVLALTSETHALACARGLEWNEVEWSGASALPFGASHCFSRHRKRGREEHLAHSARASRLPFPARPAETLICALGVPRTARERVQCLSSHAPDHHSQVRRGRRGLEFAILDRKDGRAGTAGVVLCWRAQTKLSDSRCGTVPSADSRHTWTYFWKTIADSSASSNGFHLQSLHRPVALKLTQPGPIHL